MKKVRLFTDEQRHNWGSLLSGIGLGLGWLVFIDGALVGYTWEGYARPPWYWWFPGPISTLAYVLLNLVTLHDLSPYNLMLNPEVHMRMRLWLFGAMIFSCLPVAGSIGVMIAMFVYHGSTWPAIAVVMQTTCIFLSSLLFLWSRMIGRGENIPDS